MEFCCKNAGTFWFWFRYEAISFQIYKDKTLLLQNESMLGCSSGRWTITLKESRKMRSQITSGKTLLCFSRIILRDTFCKVTFCCEKTSRPKCFFLILSF